MRFHLASAEVFVPDGLPEDEALARTTHLCVGAHQDDIEIMASAPILECFQQSDKWFTGVVVTDGRGSPRDELYKDYSDDAMRLVRFREQRKAAVVGEYAAQVMLDYPSKTVKDAARPEPQEDLVRVLQATRPRVVYTHNPADKHDTHVAVCLRVIQAIRSLAPAERPARLIGCEIWRALDWMADADKVVMDISSHPNLQAALLGVFDSQIAGGKRYDAATLGRRAANATFFESHAVDQAAGLTFGMDLTPLIADPSLRVTELVQRTIEHFGQDVLSRIERVNTPARAPAE